VILLLTERKLLLTVYYYCVSLQLILLLCGIGISSIPCGDGGIDDIYSHLLCALLLSIVIY
jgi:hypothetical protein